MKLITEDSRFQKIAGYVKKATGHYDSGHDWMHIERVVRTSLFILEREKGADYDAVVLGALMHDVGDRKFSSGDHKPEMELVMKESGFSAEIVNKVLDINVNISFSSGNNAAEKSPELMIVQDADRLDAIGAIGIARAFSYGGFKNRPFYDPDHSLIPAGDMEAYKAVISPTINHFYEKLLLLREMMNTRTGRELAEERHRFMEQFLEQFYREWHMRE